MEEACAIVESMEKPRVQVRVALFCGNVHFPPGGVLREACGRKFPGVQMAEACACVEAQVQVCPACSRELVFVGGTRLWD
jgi:hypothetical protein